MRSQRRINIQVIFLVNCIVKKRKVALFSFIICRNLIQACLPEIFSCLNKSYRSITGRMTARQMEERILKLLDTWLNWSTLSPVYIYGLEAIFRMTDSDCARMLVLDVNNDTVAPSPEDLEWERLQRRARIAGVSEIVWNSLSDGSDIQQNGSTSVMTPLQLYNTLAFVNDFVKKKTITEEAAYVPNFDVEYEPPLPSIQGSKSSYPLANVSSVSSSGIEDVDGVPLPENNWVSVLSKNSSYDDIDGIDIDEPQIAGDDIDGVAIDYDDNIDGTPIDMANDNVNIDGDPLD